ncbi:hypothetical protein K1T73_17625 [Roseovarius sp. SCSIO 43702]|uniref:hypothetical protein n=1 Tax=Roseovarius sp. SCSIO 43702 TaxID=2823043 RepID=UPI001C73C7B3|nr:hypothetical protein [Roseovarius sp. SCSIO 43702]QYX56823.1 hypothetical protein K1T73_17625 [Roseovarius sp. SCSIO 43702]
MKIKTLLFTIALIPSGALAQQGFTCSYGDRGACLGYGDTVCSSSGKCVSENAACFDSYQCDYEGFTCKSNVTECAEAHDALLRKHNDLVDDFNENLEIARGMAARLEDVETCLIYASTLEDAKLCAP